MKIGNTAINDYLLSDKPSQKNIKSGLKIIPMKCHGRISVFGKLHVVSCSCISKFSINYIYLPLHTTNYISWPSF